LFLVAIDFSTLANAIQEMWAQRVTVLETGSNVYEHTDNVLGLLQSWRSMSHKVNHEQQLPNSLE
jgi:hypothetical protein